jgi:hypothetical protein
MMAEKNEGEGRRWSDALSAGGLGVGFLLLYLRTLCPTVYLGDSGEFCTAIATGGIAHPPGYPLFSLLGRVVLCLIPWGEPAFRIGCVVAMAAAVAVVALYFLARELRCAPGAAAAAAALFGAGYTFWNQATRVEVYSLHVLLAAVLLLGCLRYRHTGNVGWLAAAVLAGSLGLAHHLTIVLVVPAALVLVGSRLGERTGREGQLALVGALLLIGPALYGLLIVWARAEPLQSWGRPINVSLLWNHASARMYQGNLRWPDGPHLFQGLREAGALYGDSFPYLTCLLPLAGMWLLWQRDRGIVVGLGLAALAPVCYNLCYRIQDIAPYYLTTWWVAAALVAVALEALVGRVQGSVRRRVCSGVLLALALGMLLQRNWGACDLSRVTWVREFARHKLESTEPGGVLITQWDPDTFPIWYVQSLLKVRPDVLHIDRAMVMGTWLNYDREPSLWYLHRLQREGLALSIPAAPDAATRAAWGQDGYLIGLLRKDLAARPLCVTFGASDLPASQDPGVFFRWARRRYQSVPQGILLRLQPRSQPVHLGELLAKNARLWGNIKLPDLHGVRMDQDLDPDYVVNQYGSMLVNFGNLYEMAGDRHRAEVIYRHAVTWAPSYAPALAALRSLARSGKP